MDDLTDIERLKRLAIIGMFSDDELMERLVLKGGNLLDVVYNVSTRASVDLDFSIDGKFETQEYLHERVTNAVTATFAEAGSRVAAAGARRQATTETETRTPGNGSNGSSRRRQ